MSQQPVIINARESDDVLPLLREAWANLPAHWRRHGLRWWRGGRAEKALKKDVLRMLSARGAPDESRERPLQPLGVDCAEMVGLDREIVLTPRGNWCVLASPPFVEPQAAVVIMNIGPIG